MSTTPHPLDGLVDLLAERVAQKLAAASAAGPTPREAQDWRLLTVDDVAKRLGRSERWLRERVKRGELPYVKLDGGALAFLLEDVQAFARGRRISAEDASPLADRLRQATDAAPGAGSGNSHRPPKLRVNR